MATADVKTALLSEAGRSTIEAAKTSATKKYNSYETKHGHVDNKEERDKLDEVLEGIDDTGLRWSIIFLDKLSKIIISVFSFVCMATGAAVAFGIVGLFAPTFVWLIVILAITFGGSMLGAYGVFKYGALDRYLDACKAQNKKYATSIESLKVRTIELKKDVHGITDSVDTLKDDSKELNETVHQYDDIRRQLQELVGDDGDMKDINDMVDSINDGYDSMSQMIINNRKAALLATYYGVATRDGDTALSKKEWERFLARLDISSRKKFASKGTFEQIAGRDSLIDLNEFQDLVDSIIIECDEEIMDLINKHGK